MIGVQLMVIYAAASVLELLGWTRFNGLLLQCSGGELWCRTLYIMSDIISGLKSRAPMERSRTMIELFLAAEYELLEELTEMERKEQK